MADAHHYYMQRALKLAKKGQFTVSPNPMVGCVLVKHGTIIAEGWHQLAGCDHAEVRALAKAGAKAQGASMYINLEPCAHYGRTPPCVEAVIASGIVEVYIACVDPNPKVAGKGIAKLQAAGIAVHVGLCESAAKALNKFFFHYIQYQRPYVIAKWAMSLDGKIAVHKGDQPAISGAVAKQQVHRLRQRVDAILVGAGTVRADNPALTVRLAHSKVNKHPLRIILCTHANIAPNAQIFSGELPGNTLLVTTSDCDPAWREALQGQGVEVLVLPADATGRVSIAALLSALGQRQLSSLLVEGGMEVLHSFFAADAINEIEVYLAPVIIGTLNHKQKLVRMTSRKQGEDFHFNALWETQHV